MVRRAEASGMLQAYERHTYTHLDKVQSYNSVTAGPDRDRRTAPLFDSAAECRDLTAHARATLAADAFVGGAVTQRLGTFRGLITGLRSKPKYTE